MALPAYEKHPDEIIAVPIIVRNLGSNTLSNPASTATPSGLTIVSTTVSGNTVTALIGGGVDGTEYQVETAFDVSNGEHRVKEYLIVVRDN